MTIKSFAVVLIVAIGAGIGGAIWNESQEPIITSCDEIVRKAVRSAEAKCWTTCADIVDGTIK